MNRDKAFRQYMVSHVRLNSINPPDAWTDTDLAQSYATLKPPHVTFEAWCAAFGLTLENPEQAANETAIMAILGDKDTPGAPPVEVSATKE